MLAARVLSSPKSIIGSETHRKRGKVTIDSVPTDSIAFSGWNPLCRNPKKWEAERVFIPATQKGEWHHPVRATLAPRITMQEVGWDREPETKRYDAS